MVCPVGLYGRLASSSPSGTLARVSVLLKPTISETGVKLPLRKKRRVNREPTRVAGRDRA